MSDCNNSSEDCKPIGSPDADPCSPCFEPGPTSFYDTLATLSRQVCSILSSIKSWGATIARIRNRLDALEERMDNLAEPEGTCDGASEGETECLPLLLGCNGGEPSYLAAAEGFILGAVSDGDGGFCWGRVARAGGVTGTKQVFGYTGAYQTLTIPADVANIRIKAWGAFGASDELGGNPHAAPGGGGGYTEGNLAVTPGDTYTVVVGQLPPFPPGGHNGTFYGFGGGTNDAPFQLNTGGGGLSGLFTGNSEVAYTDSARAILIAGGGGAGGTSSVAVISNGFPGNGAGGMGDMRGFNAFGQAEGSGGGGGGRIGGNNHLGGSGYVNGSITGGSIVSGATVAGGYTNIAGYGNSSDLDLVSNTPGGYGLVVVEFFS